MSPPVRGFRPDARPPGEVWADISTVQGMMLREAVAAGPDRQRALSRIRERFEALASQLWPAADELRALVASHEPVELISSVVIPANMRFYGKQESLGDLTETETWPAKVEYLVGVALSVPPGTGSTPSDVTQRVMDLVSDVFDASQAQQMLDSFDGPRMRNAPLEEVLFMLRMEHLFDRMPGYAVHLERIDAEIFNRHRDFYVDALGFNPADVAYVVRRRGTANQARANAAMRTMQRLRNRDPGGSALAMAQILRAMTDSRTWHANDVADDTGVEAEQISRMLAFFSTTFGAQPAFRLPTDQNLARTHPVIDLGTGAYFVPDPWSLAAAVHDRLAQVAAADDSGSLRRYHKHREEGHQRLVANAVRTVFPDDLVFEKQHYVSEANGPGEIDVLVAIDWPLLIEAKAHSLTESGRRGAPRRVQRVARDVMDKALQQTRRSVGYILDEGQRGFAPEQNGVPVDVLPHQVAGATEIIVTFERIDPLAMVGPAVVQQDGRCVWTVGIADFLMVTEVLGDPTALHHYARTRAGTAVHGPVVYVESDALGAYLLDRLRLPAQAAHQPDATVMVGYTSQAINDYYTATELGLPATHLVTGVPSEVAAAMSGAISSPTGLWTQVADAVMEARPDTWRRWRKYRRRHRKGGRFELTPEVHLILGTAADGLTLEGTTAALRVPPRSSSNR